MSDIISQVLNYKRQKEAEARADIDAIPQAINTFIMAQREAKKTALETLLAESTIAKNQSDILKSQRESSLLSGFFGGSQLDQNGNISGPIQATEATVGGVKFENKALKNQAKQEEKNLEVDTAIKKDSLTRFNKLDELIPLLDQFDQQLNSIPVDTGVKGKMQGIKLQVKGAIGKDPFAAANISQVDATRALAARAFGDVGNLSQPEQENAKKFFALATDPADTRVLKAIGGLSLLKKKFTQTAQKAGLSDSDLFKEKLSAIDERLQAKIAQAKELGIDSDRLAEFSGNPQKKQENVSLPEGITESDIQFTMKKHNLSRQQVLDRIKNA